MHKALITSSRAVSSYDKNHEEENKSRIQNSEGFLSEKLKLAL